MGCADGWLTRAVNDHGVRLPYACGAGAGQRAGVGGQAGQGADRCRPRPDRAQRHLTHDSYVGGWLSVLDPVIGTPLSATLQPAVSRPPVPAGTGLERDIVVITRAVRAVALA